MAIKQENVKNKLKNIKDRHLKIYGMKRKVDRLNLEIKEKKNDDCENLLEDLDALYD